MFSDCDLQCLLATGLFGGMLYTMLNQNKNVITNDFEKTLNEEQKKVYKAIMKERITIYLQGLVFGLLVGFIYLNYISKSSTKSACMFAVIVLGVNNLYYALYPKSQYMVPLLETEEQRTAWLAVYKEMKYRNYMGFIMGLVAYLLIGLYA